MKDFKGNNFSEQIYSWSATNETASYVYNGATNTYDPIPDYWEWTPPAIPDQDQTYGCATCGPGYEMWNLTHYYGSVQYHYDVGSDMSEDMAEQAQTHQRLYTGGRAGINRNNLFCLYASATAYGAPPQADTAYPWWLTPGITVPGRSLQVGGKPVGADGKLWLALPDNSDIDLTVAAPGKKHYDATATQQKYKLHIFANNYPLASDRVRPNANYCVGEYINFTQGFIPPLPETPQYSPIQWEMSGLFINSTNGRPAWPDGSMGYGTNPRLLQAMSTYAWWYDGGYNAPTYKATLGEGLTFQNGQYVAITVLGRFTMHKPSLVNYVPQPIGCAVRHWHLQGTAPFPLILAQVEDTLITSPNTYYTLQVDAIKPFDGLSMITQVLDGLGTDALILNSTFGEEYLDNTANYYSVAPGDNSYFSVKSGNVSQSSLFLTDQPAITCDNHTAQNFTFTDYIQYKPNAGPGPNIFVTLGIVGWSISASTDLTTVPGTSVQDYTPFSTATSGDDLPDDESTGSAHLDSGPTEYNWFPYWVHTLTNIGN